MKKTFLLLLTAVLLSVASAFAQPQMMNHKPFVKTNPSPPTKKPQTNLAMKQCLDSIVSPWNFKYIFSYDTRGNTILSALYFWDGYIEKWYGTQKFEYEYDKDGNIIMKIFYDKWNVVTNNWIATNKEEFTYDSHGNPITSVFYDWNEVTNSWIEGLNWKYENTYENGNLIMIVGYCWDVDWIKRNKVEFEYDNNGNQTIEINYWWENNGWIGTEKIEYAYDQHRNIILDAGYYWNSETHNWEGYKWRFKHEYEYDNNGNPVISFMYSWNDEWTLSLKKEFVFDLSYSIGELIIPGSTYLYSGVNMLTEIISYMHLDTGFLCSDYNIYYWSPKDITGIVETHNCASLRVYPNPTTGVLNIQETMNNEQLTMNNVEVFDIYGRKVISDMRLSDMRYPTSEIGKSEITINISHLPAGIYFLKVGNETVKVVKQ